MIKCEVIKDFTLGKFDELKNVKRRNVNRNKHKELYIGDTFECDEKMAKYLLGDNPKNDKVVKIIEMKLDK